MQSYRVAGLAALLASSLALAGPAVAQEPDVAGLSAALIASCSLVDDAQYEGTGGEHLRACWAAQAAVFAAAPKVDPGSQEQLGQAWVQAVYQGQPSPDGLGRTVLPVLEADLTGAIAKACTEGYRGNPPVLGECLAVTRTAFATSSVLSKAEIDGLGRWVCDIPTFAPPDFRVPFFALIDEITARGMSGSDPVIAGDFTELIKSRTTPDSTSCR